MFIKVSLKGERKLLFDKRDMNCDIAFSEELILQLN